MKASKKIMLVAAVLLLAAALFVGAGAAATVTVSSQQQLEEAIAAATGETTEIVLINDIGNMSGITVQEGKNFILNLNAHTLTFTHDPTGSGSSKNQCFQFLKNSTITIKNGDIVVNPDAGATFKFVIQNYANLTLTNVNVDGSKLNANSQYAVSTNNGEVVIDGATSITAPNGGVALDAYNWVESYSAGTQATINTSGTFKGAITFGSSSGTTEATFASTLKINAGTFIGDISTYKEGTTGVADVSKDKLQIAGGSFTVSGPAAKALIEKYNTSGSPLPITIGQNTLLTLGVDESYTLFIPATFTFVKSGSEYVASANDVGVTNIMVGAEKGVSVSVTSAGGWKLTGLNTEYSAMFGQTNMKTTSPFINKVTQDTTETMKFTQTGTVGAGTHTDTLTFTAVVE